VVFGGRLHVGEGEEGILALSCFRKGGPAVIASENVQQGEVVPVDDPLARILFAKGVVVYGRGADL